jgi:phage terminase large subunit-like protein
MDAQQAQEIFDRESEDVKKAVGLDPRIPEQAHILSVLIDREFCPRYFYYFVRQAWSRAFDGEKFIDGWHIAALCCHLQSLWDGNLRTLDGEQSDTLVINTPPSCSKSRLTCVMYPAWLWLKDPSVGLWFSSFGQGLCDRDALKTRQLLLSNWYRERFWPDIKLTDDQNQKRRYDNTRGGWRLSASIGSKVGFGEHPRLLACDDPHDPEEVDNDQRLKAIDVWDNKYSTRGVIKGVKRVLIAQRLHEEDLSQHVLDIEDDAAHLCLPMEYEPDRKCRTNIAYHDIDDIDEKGDPILKDSWEDPRAEEGELLWPEGFGEKKVAKTKKRLRRAHAISGQLQQNPTAPDGDMFLLESFMDIVPMSDVPLNCPAARAWDLASATGTRADFTAGVLGVFDGHFLYIVNAMEGKMKRKKRDAEIRKVCGKDAEMCPQYHVRLEQEGGAGGKDAAEMMAEKMSSEFRMVIDKPLGKPTGKDQTLKGWETWANLLSDGLVKLVRGKWNQRFIQQHTAAPFGRNDDLIDAASRVARGLYRRTTKRKLKRPLLGEDSESQKTDCKLCGGMGCEVCEVKERVELTRDQELAGLLQGVPGEEGELGVTW